MGGWQDGARQGEWWAARLADDLAGASKQFASGRVSGQRPGAIPPRHNPGRQQSGRRLASCSEPSPAMLRPDSRDLLIRRKFATQNLSVRFCKVGVFFRSQLDRWLIHTGELQQDAHLVA